MTITNELRAKQWDLIVHGGGLHFFGWGWDRSRWGGGSPFMGYGPPHCPMLGSPEVLFIIFFLGGKVAGSR